MTGESVEQAARVAGWKERADREAAAILGEVTVGSYVHYSTLQTLVAVGWLQGASFGAHDALDKIDKAFGLAKAEL